MDKSPDAFRTISEVAEDLDLPQHVLRFWETRFPQIKPMKRGGGRRYYRPDDVALITGLKALLYGQGYTIKGVQRILKEQGAKSVQAVGRGGALPLAAPVQNIGELRARAELEGGMSPHEVMPSAAPRQPMPDPRAAPSPVQADVQTILREALTDIEAARNDLARALSRQTAN
ncbi:MAG: MerR family transcriptional regulator [Bosea sp. (in: a-proteobacteria)]